LISNAAISQPTQPLQAAGESQPKAATTTDTQEQLLMPNRYIVAEVTMDPRKSLDKLLQLERDLLFLLERQKYNFATATAPAISSGETSSSSDDESQVQQNSRENNNSTRKLRPSHRRGQSLQLTVLDIVELAGLISRSTGRRRRASTAQSTTSSNNRQSRQPTDFETTVKHNLIEYQSALPLCTELMLAGRFMVMIDNTDVGTFLSDQVSEIASTVSDLSEQLVLMNDDEDQQLVHRLQLEEAQLKRDAAEKLYLTAQRQLQLADLDKWNRDVQILRDKITYWRGRGEQQEVERLTMELDRLMR
jgi:hypothetical protein